VYVTDSVLCKRKTESAGANKRICETPPNKVGLARTADANGVAAYIGVARQILDFYIQKMRNCPIKFTYRKT